QNVNKVATKVELRFDLPRSRVLSPPVKQRLSALAAGRLDSLGRLMVVADSTRSQSRNLELARGKLCELLRAALVAPKRRRPTKPSAGARRRRVEAKRHTAEKKRGRRSSDFD
ncbi:MAG TPA: alternative ribosome rescue aminoacyl-tRNA hydrolase ArfB, partial [Polyangiaceae bacterium]|nr:alternative ribosome rescue aminoacyl-tRNA hydrolase ArfB [Polyangiaceae bacterium]